MGTFVRSCHVMPVLLQMFWRTISAMWYVFMKITVDCLFMSYLCAFVGVVLSQLLSGTSLQRWNRLNGVAVIMLWSLWLFSTTFYLWCLSSRTDTWQTLQKGFDTSRRHQPTIPGNAFCVADDETTGGFPTSAYLLAQAVIAALMWLSLNAGGKRSYFVPTALAGIWPILFLFFVRMRVVVLLICMTVGYVLLLTDFWLDVCGSWTALVLLRSIIVIVFDAGGRVTSAGGDWYSCWIVTILQRGAVEGCDTIAGCFGLSAVIGYLPTAARSTVFYIVGRPSPVLPLSGTQSDDEQWKSSSIRSTALVIGIVLWNHFVGIPFSKHFTFDVYYRVVVASVTTQQLQDILNSTLASTASLYRHSIVRHLFVATLNLLLLLLPVYATYFVTSSYGCAAWVYTVVHVLVADAIRTTDALLSNMVLIVPSTTSPVTTTSEVLTTPLSSASSASREQPTSRPASPVSAALSTLSSTSSSGSLSSSYSCCVPTDCFEFSTAAAVCTWNGQRLDGWTGRSWAERLSENFYTPERRSCRAF